MRCPPPAWQSCAGQAAVESALVLPLAVFIILGLLQMGMIQQARLFADYAAYRGARAASLEMGDCHAVIRSELAALTPMLGRSDDLRTWKATFQRAVNRQPGPPQDPGALANSRPDPYVINFWEIEHPNWLDSHPIDEPVSREGDIAHIHLRLFFLYELKIPFVNWVLGRMYLAQFGFGGYGGKVDPLHPTTLAQDPARLANWEYAQVGAAVREYSRLDPPRYVVPLYASWSMRMFSRAFARNEDYDGSGQKYCR